MNVVEFSILFLSVVHVRMLLGVLRCVLWQVLGDFVFCLLAKALSQLRDSNSGPSHYE